MVDTHKTIQDLPDKILIEIFSHLDADTFIQITSVCKKWNELIETNMDYFSSLFADLEEQEELSKQQNENNNNHNNNNILDIDDDLDDLPRKPSSNNNNNNSTTTTTTTTTTTKTIPQEITFLNANGEKYTEEQKMFVDNILSISPKQYTELLAVGEGASEDDIRSQYKKLSLILHPDKNKAPGSNNAFQILKKAFDALLSGVDPEDKDTCAINCPDTTNCNAIVYLSSERFKNIMRGSDVGFCKSCKSKFGRIFCPHCLASWTMLLTPADEGQIVQCSQCFRQFAKRYPKQLPQKPTPPPQPPISQSQQRFGVPNQQQQQQQQQKRPVPSNGASNVAKKQKTNWWS